jgi:hypothetical protein
MQGLYDLESQKRFILVNGFRNPKTWELFPREHPRFRAALKELENVSVAMERLQTPLGK